MTFQVTNEEVINNVMLMYPCGQTTSHDVHDLSPAPLLHAGTPGNKKLSGSESHSCLTLRESSEVSKRVALTPALD